MAASRSWARWSKVPRAVGLYILNEKRNHLARLHENLGLFVTISIDDALGRFLEQKEIVIDKRNKKGKMVKKDIRPYIGAMTVEKTEPAGFRFSLDLKFVEQQCVKPEIVLGTFQEMFKDDLRFENASSIHRKHLNIVD